MSKFRLIARLDIKGPNLVKGIHLEGLRVLGDPSKYASLYYTSGVDELFYMDVVASLYERNSLSEIITETAKQIFVPLTVGGGIRNIEDVRIALRAGADKVCINTGAVKNPGFIKEIVNLFGSSTVSIAIECIKQSNGSYNAFIDNGREETGLEVISWARQLQSFGVGEIVVTSVDREGTGDGLDFSLLEKLLSNVSIPIIAHGGVGSPEDVLSAAKLGVSGVAVASVIHYEALQSGSVGRSASSSEGNTRFLQDGRGFRKIKPYSVSTIKNFLIEAGIPVRSYLA